MEHNFLNVWQWKELYWGCGWTEWWKLTEDTFMEYLERNSRWKYLWSNALEKYLWSNALGKDWYNKAESFSWERLDLNDSPDYVFLSFVLTPLKSRNYGSLCTGSDIRPIFRISKSGSSPLSPTSSLSKSLSLYYGLNIYISSKCLCLLQGSELSLSIPFFPFSFFLPSSFSPFPLFTFLFKIIFFLPDFLSLYLSSKSAKEAISFSLFLFSPLFTT